MSLFVYGFRHGRFRNVEEAEEEEDYGNLSDDELVPDCHNGEQEDEDFHETLKAPITVRKAEHKEHMHYLKEITKKSLSDVPSAVPSLQEGSLWEILLHRTENPSQLEKAVAFLNCAGIQPMPLSIMQRDTLGGYSVQFYLRRVTPLPFVLHFRLVHDLMTFIEKLAGWKHIRLEFLNLTLFEGDGQWINRIFEVLQPRTISIINCTGMEQEGWKEFHQLVSSKLPHKNITYIGMERPTRSCPVPEDLIANMARNL